MIEPIPDSAGPWTSVFQTDTCAAYGYEIPAHLGERRDGMPVEKPRREWRGIYKDTRGD